MNRRSDRFDAATLAATALLACGAAFTPAAAQSCALVTGTGAGSEIAVSLGGAGYDVASLSGPTLGLDVGLTGAAGSVRAGYRTVRLDGPDPHMGRLTGALPLPFSPAGLALCATGHGGISRLQVGSESTTVGAGGMGLRVVRPVAIGQVVAHPYGEVRGLAARSTGRLLGLDLSASGLAVGVEAGVRAVTGRFTFALSAAADGFAPALGITPYPSMAAEIGIGVRF